MMRAKWWRKPLLRRPAAAWQRASGDGCGRSRFEMETPMIFPAKACCGALLALSVFPAAVQAQDVPSGPLIVSGGISTRSEEHTSELQSLMRISYAVFCLKKKKHHCMHKWYQHEVRK